MPKVLRKPASEMTATRARIVTPRATTPTARPPSMRISETGDRTKQLPPRRVTVATRVLVRVRRGLGFGLG